jgi:S-adenosylmethionine:tRNA ribosyltransferase-isomerase
MKKSDFHFDLPPELIAQAPLAERSASRLLVVPPLPAALRDGVVRDRRRCCSRATCWCSTTPG